MKHKENFSKKILIVICILLFITAIVSVGYFGFKGKNDKDDVHSFITNSLNMTEDQEEYILQFDSAAQITVGDMVQKTETNGYVTVIDELDLTHVYVNTASNTTDNAEDDFDVTVSMYTDGEKVYDNSSGVNKEIEMTPEEFNEIADGYSLYRYSRENVIDAAFNPQEVEGYGKCGEMAVVLKAPEDRVLEAYAQKLTEVTGESVEIADLKVKNATVTYNVFDDLVKSQSYAFAVEYTTESDVLVQYSVASKIDYVDSSSLLDEYDEYVPFDVLDEEETV